jgi:hypothetical protein
VVYVKEAIHDLGRIVVHKGQLSKLAHFWKYLYSCQVGALTLLPFFRTYLNRCLELIKVCGALIAGEPIFDLDETSLSDLEQRKPKPV